MPTYEFRCPDGHVFDKFYRSISAAEAEVPCPTCGKPAARQISGGAGLQFKGSGFYLTDYGKNAHRSGGAKPAGASGEGKAGGDAAGPSTSGDSAKPAASAEGASGGSSSGTSSGTSAGTSSGSSSTGGAKSGGEA